MEGFCVTDIALMASLVILPVSRVTSPFKATTTAGSRATHSVAFDLKRAASPERTGAQTVAQPGSC